jgi:hypothetical protein
MRGEFTVPLAPLPSGGSVVSGTPGRPPLCEVWPYDVAMRQAQGMDEDGEGAVEDLSNVRKEDTSQGSAPGRVPEREHVSAVQPLPPSAVVHDGIARGVMHVIGGRASDATWAFESAVAREGKRHADNNGIGTDAAAKRIGMPLKRMRELARHDPDLFLRRLRWHILSIIASGEVRLPAMVPEIHDQLLKRGDGLYRTAMNRGVCGLTVITGLIRDQLLDVEVAGMYCNVLGVRQDQIRSPLVEAVMRALTAELGRPARQEDIEAVVERARPKLRGNANAVQLSLSSVIQDMIDAKKLRVNEDGLIEPTSWHSRTSLSAPDHREDFLRDVADWLYLSQVAVAEEVLRVDETPAVERTAFICDLVVFRPETMTLSDFKAAVWTFGIQRARELETEARKAGTPLVPVRIVSVAAGPDVVPLSASQLAATRPSASQPATARRNRRRRRR